MRTGLVGVVVSRGVGRLRSAPRRKTAAPCARRRNLVRAARRRVQEVNREINPSAGAEYFTLLPFGSGTGRTALTSIDVLVPIYLVLYHEGKLFWEPNLLNPH